MSHGGLGEIIVQVGSHRICRDGISYRKQVMRWKDVKQVFISGQKRTINFFVPSGEEMDLTVANSAGLTITIQMSAWFRLGRHKHEEFAEIYRYIVSQVMERQWNQFKEKLDSGRRLSFRTFGIAPSAIYQKTPFSGLKVFKLSRICGCNIREGNFYLLYLDRKVKIKEYKLGVIANIPNIHIAEVFINAIAEQNSQSWSAGRYRMK